MEQTNITVKDKALTLLKYTFIIVAIVAVIAITCFVVKNTARNAARASIKYPTVELNAY